MNYRPISENTHCIPVQKLTSELPLGKSKYYSLSAAHAPVNSYVRTTIVSTKLHRYAFLTLENWNIY